MKYQKFSHKTPHLKGKQHQLDPNLDLKQLVHHSTVQYVDRDADGDVDVYDNPKKKTPDENPTGVDVGALSKKLIAKQKGELKHTKRGLAYEETKSGDDSLHDWFTKSRASDGTPGWVQLGGKYAGKPCAKQPGQTTKPKCGSSKMKRDLDKGEEEAAFRRKNRKDPNPERKGAAINVKTEAKEEVRYCTKCKKMETRGECSYGPEMWDKMTVKGFSEASLKDHEYSMARSQLSTVMDAAKRLRKKMKKGEGEVEAWVQSKITKAADYLDSAADYVDSGEMKVEYTILPLHIEIPTNIRDFNLGLMFRESLEQNSGMLFIFDEVVKQSFHMTETRIPLDIAFINEEGIIESIKELDPFNKTPVSSDGEVICALEVNRGWFEENNIEVGDEIDIEEASGEKDACYSKVKSRYKVWPSAYASGALVKCRKVGAANWGNKTKKEELELDEKCWSGYEKKGMKTMFGKRYPNCVKKEETIEDANGNTFAEVIDLIKPDPIKKVEESVRIPAKTGNIILVTLNWRGKLYMMKLFFPQITKPNRQEVQDQIEKVYPGSRVQSYYVSDIKPGEQFLQVEGAAWTKKSGKSESGGLNEKGRRSYERENPGSNLKSPSKKVGNKRRASFCARMKGMKKKLTSSKTANDPDSRINKSLRAWNC
jgi:uncharacterized membrane protein (UPF0127 family)/cytochrome c2